MSDTLFSNREYVFPPISLLNSEPIDTEKWIAEADAGMTELPKILADLKIPIDGHITYTMSPSVICYAVHPFLPKHTRKLLKSEDELAFRLNTLRGVRAYIRNGKPDTAYIEVPRHNRDILCLREIMESKEFTEATGSLNVALGVNSDAENVVFDLARMPHLLVAGTTCSGKSVFINNLLMSLLYAKTPDELKLILIDPKKVEFTAYKDIPHLLTPIISSPKQAIMALMRATEMMENRYDLFSEIRVRNIQDYNKKVGDNKLPYVVIVIDELADLMMTNKDDAETAIARLAQKARAAGIYMVVSTQRPRKDTISDYIKINIPSRIAFSTVSLSDSRTILDASGAEKLQGAGDMLFAPFTGNAPSRVQCCFVGDNEVRKVCEFIRSCNPPVEYDASFLPPRE